MSRPPFQPMTALGPDFIGHTHPEDAAQLALARQIQDGIARGREEQVQFSEAIGMLKFAQFQKKVVTVTTIKLLAELKESKKYKNLSLVGEDGNPVPVTTFSDLCQAMGLSYEKVNQDIQNLSAFGEEFLESAQRIGLGYRQLRALRKLPDDDQIQVIQGEAVRTNDKEALLDLIEDLSAKAQRDKEALAAERDSARADYRARQAALDEATQANAELREQVARLKSPTQNEAVRLRSGQREELVRAVQSASHSVVCAWARFEAATADFRDSDGDGPMTDLVASTLRWLISLTHQTALEYGVYLNPDEIAPEPAWMREARESAEG